MSAFVAALVVAFEQHAIILPILLPLATAAVLVLINERRHRLKLAINVSGVLATLAVALWLLVTVDGGHWQHDTAVYLAANWPLPLGIALVLDRLTALMLVLAAGLSLAALTFSTARWSRIGVHFHSLFQLLLMGLSGAFLTGDLFNLFVFFEVMLAASYGLVLHGYNRERLRAGMLYIVVNLVGSSLFLIGIALVFAAAGTLNMADIAARAGGLAGFDRGLLEAGAAVLAVAFLTKCGSWPLCFWLPSTYAASAPPVAAMMVLVSKVGFYAILRLWLLVFPAVAGAAPFGGSALLWIGVATIVFGAIGALASDEPRRLAGYSAIVSSGTLLAALGFAEPALVAAALFYLVSSTLGLACFLLLVELIDRVRTPAAAVLALTLEAFAMEDAAEETAGFAIPAALSFIGLAFMGCAMVIVGLPPLSGFLSKFVLFEALLARPVIGPMPLAIMALLLASGLVTLLALMRYGVRTFWSLGPAESPRLRLSEAAPVAVLLVAGACMTVLAGPVMGYLDRTAEGLFVQEDALQRVLETGVVARADDAGPPP